MSVIGQRVIGTGFVQVRRNPLWVLPIKPQRPVLFAERRKRK